MADISSRRRYSNDTLSYVDIKTVKNLREGENGLFNTLVSKFYNNVFLFVLIGWLIKLSVRTFQPIILIYRKYNYVYHHWKCTSIYQ